MPQMHSVADPPLRLAGLVPQLRRSTSSQIHLFA